MPLPPTVSPAADMPLQHDPADRATCDFCGIAEDIHLLDGVLNDQERPTDRFACIRCYPKPDGPDGWRPTGESFIAVSIAPELAPLYVAYIKRRRIEAASRRAAKAQETVQKLRAIRDDLRDLELNKAADYVARALKMATAAVKPAHQAVRDAINS